jgi:hypothetical protein
MPRREEHNGWFGGRYVDKQGYVRVLPSDEDLASGLAKPGANGYVAEHRLVMARHLGRPLHPDETVHHRRGKTENQIEHLELWSGRHPKGQRVEDLVEFALEILERYAPGDLAEHVRPVTT